MFDRLWGDSSNESGNSQAFLYLRFQPAVQKVVMNITYIPQLVMKVVSNEIAVVCKY